MVTLSELHSGNCRSGGFSVTCTVMPEYINMSGIALPIEMLPAKTCVKTQQFVLNWLLVL